MQLHPKTKVPVLSKLLDAICHFEEMGDIHGQSYQYTAKKNSFPYRK